jgi:hypothetical protein
VAKGRVMRPWALGEIVRLDDGREGPVVGILGNPGDNPLVAIEVDGVRYVFWGRTMEARRCASSS